MAGAQAIMVGAVGLPRLPRKRSIPLAQALGGNR
jgi:hypothetical protein